MARGFVALVAAIALVAASPGARAARPPGVVAVAGGGARSSHTLRADQAVAAPAPSPGWAWPAWASALWSWAPRPRIAEDEGDDPLTCELPSTPRVRSCALPTPPRPARSVLTRCMAVHRLRAPPPPATGLAPAHVPLLPRPSLPAAAGECESGDIRRYGLKLLREIPVAGLFEDMRDVTKVRGPT